MVTRRIDCRAWRRWTTDVSGFSSVMKTWKLFGSPVYGAGSGMRGRGWGSLGEGYLGVGHPPYFVFGGYSPSEGGRFGAVCRWNK